jgi:endonuclease III
MPGQIMSDATVIPIHHFDRAGRARHAQALLESHYGRPAPALVQGRPELLPRLIRVLISQNTSRANQQQAWERLQQRFPDLALIADAPLVDVIDAIHVAGLAKSRAPRLQDMITRLLEYTDGTLDLGFLYDMPLDEARGFLMNLPGLGPLSAALVLLFGMGRPVLPVNTGLLRVAQRVGMVPRGTSAERAALLLQGWLEDDDVYSFHVTMVRLAREVCTAGQPACIHCPLAPVCDWAHRGD